MRNFFRAAAAAVMIVSTPVNAGNSVEDHRELWTAVERAGVTVMLNHPEMCGGGVHGFYASVDQAMMICQDRSKKSFDHVEWTENDFDTLRHEAQHLLQDCKDGRVGDGRLVPALSAEYLAEIAEDSGMTAADVRQIQESYGSKGASDEVIRNEVEAFIVARAIPASTLAETLLKHCTL